MEFRETPYTATANSAGDNSGDAQNPEVFFNRETPGDNRKELVARSTSSSAPLTSSHFEKNFGEVLSSQKGREIKHDPSCDLEEFLSNDTTRLNLKWEQPHRQLPENGSNHSNNTCAKILLGTNTYLPLGDRACFSLDIPHPPSPSPLSPCQQKEPSARGILFRLVSKIVTLSPRIKHLNLEGFGCKKAEKGPKRPSPTDSAPIQKTGTLDIEDVFEAFAGNEASTWRTGFLATIETWDCDMDSHHGNHSFDLAEHEYPKGLEYVFVHSPRGSVVSASIFKITARAPKLHRLYINQGHNEDDDDFLSEDDSDSDSDDDDDDDVDDWNDNNADTDSIRRSRRLGPSDSNSNRTNDGNKVYRFDGSRLTKSSIEAICEVLSSPNQLLEMNQLPFRELLQLPEADFCHILKATTITRIPGTAAPSGRVSPVRYGYERAKLRFPIDRNAARAKMTSNLTFVATRAEALRFYLLWKRSLEVLRDTEMRSLYPLVLEKCQERKSMLQWIPCNQNDLLFAMLKDSLESMLKGRKAVGSEENPTEVDQVSDRSFSSFGSVVANFDSIALD